MKWKIKDTNLEDGLNAEVKSEIEKIKKQQKNSKNGRFSLQIR